MRPPCSIYLCAAFLTLSCLAIPSFSQEDNTRLLVLPSSRAAMEKIAVQLAEKLERIGCGSSECSLLVADFNTSPDSTSPAGLEISDETANLLAAQLPKVKLMPRSSWAAFQSRNQIPFKLLDDDEAIRWIGRELGATAVVTGELSFEPGNSTLRFKMIDCRPRKKKVEGFNDKLPELKLEPEALQPIERHSGEVKVLQNDRGEVIPRAGKLGVTTPHCTFTPNPRYSEAARHAKFSGYLLVDAIVDVNGSVQPIRVRRGLPYNLNEQAQKTLATWRCEPATQNGRAVPALVEFEVNFRLY
jgi:TonB family protein